MSGRLKITFTPDMPPAAVEVVSPDFSTVERLWLSPGEQKAVDVPSEASFLRVHLPSGEIVTLKDPGNLNRTISASNLISRRASTTGAESTSPRRRNRREVRQRAAAPVLESPVAASAQTTLEGNLQVTLTGGDGLQQQNGKIHEQNTAVVFQPPTVMWDRYLLTLKTPEMSVRVRLPGSANEVIVRSDQLEDGPRLVSVRAKTSDAHADAIAGYLHRGDLYSASSATDWAEKAEDLLSDKRRDPFAAAVGAYLLLRIRRLDLLHDWTRNLLDWFPALYDAPIIRAWHLIYARKDESEIRKLFARALDGPLPIFTEGLRLLSDGVRLLGDDSDEAVKKLNHHARRALNRSPFTATMERSALPAGWDVDIDYAPQA